MILKQKTLSDGTTLKLKRRSARGDGSRYEYYVVEEGGGRVDRYEPTRERGMEQFRETVRIYERQAEDGAGGGGFGGGLFGSGPDMDLPALSGTDDDGPIIPGMDDPWMRGDDEDDDEPQLPFF